MAIYVLGYVPSPPSPFGPLLTSRSPPRFLPLWQRVPARPTAKWFTHPTPAVSPKQGLTHYPCVVEPDPRADWPYMDGPHGFLVPTPPSLISPEEQRMIDLCRPWETYAVLQSFERAGYIDSHDWQAHRELLLPVGTLLGHGGVDTARVVYATFGRADDESWEVHLVAYPFATVQGTLHPQDEFSVLVKEEHYTNLHHMAGFAASARVLDWSLVQFYDRYGGEPPRTQETYRKTLADLARLAAEGGTLRLAMGQRYDD